MLEELDRTETPKRTIRTILVVEDDEDTGKFFAHAFSALTPYHVFVARNSTQALTFVNHIIPSLCILDYRLIPKSSIDLYDQLYAIPQLAQMPCILVNATSSNELQPYLETRKLIFIEKPFDLDEFLRIVHEVLNEQ
jgi:DNA-binding NtrC family response regulator